MKIMTELRGLDWLKEISDATLTGMLKASTRVDCRASDTIFSPQDVPQSVYLLEHGLVRIFRIAPSGAEATFGFVLPGEVFGEMVAFGDYSRRSFAVALKPSIVWKIPRELFQSSIFECPEAAIEVARQVINRFKRIEDRVEDLVFRGVRSRVAHVLLELAQDFGCKQDGGLKIDVTLTQAELATLVGATRQSVNASLQELEKEGLLKLNGRNIFLTQPEELIRTLDQESVPES